MSLNGQEIQKGSLHDLTRSVYEKQHERIATDDLAFDRIYNIYANANLGIPGDWWKGKVALDAGCGNFGAFMLWLIHQQVDKVCGIDLGENWIEKLESSLVRRGAKEGSFELKSGSVLAIPFPGDTFDFVAINGVLVHLDSLEEICQGFSEGARVCKKDGYFFTTYGPCGGMLMEAIFPALQKYYRENLEFKKFIDEINPTLLHDAIDYIVKEHSAHTGEALDGEQIKALFGEDYCVFLQNYIQRPTDFSNQCTPDFVEGLYRRHGFGNVTRLNHFVKRTDIRKYFAPLHFDWTNPVAKALYGAGFVQYIGKKL